MFLLSGHTSRTHCQARTSHKQSGTIVVVVIRASLSVSVSLSVSLYVSLCSPFGKAAVWTAWIGQSRKRCGSGVREQWLRCGNGNVPIGGNANVPIGGNGNVPIGGNANVPIVGHSYVDGR